MRLSIAVSLALAAAVWLVVGSREASSASRTKYGFIVAAICIGIVGIQYTTALLPKLSGVGHKLNLQRKIQHIATGLALALIFLLFSAQVCTLALGAGTLALILLQVARAASETVNLEFLRLFGSMLKKEERSATRPPAAVFFLLGLFLSLVTFPRRLTLLCTLVATLADPFAAIGGTAFGGPLLQLSAAHKSLGGCITCLSVAALLAVAVVLTTPGAEHTAPSATDTAVVGLFCGLAAAACEVAGGATSWLDDNLLVSFGTGLLIKVFAMVVDFAGLESKALLALLS
ncbi:unnamed protein product [Symbiodinium natans]|uniref:Dolichol kinase n=1 Tax=Symbiodinium natans TaxID=878477 RepID=A0A812RQD2_9DINO|nr:unnamed protein product [Symbiodinium natans]